jgi:hypothetical protein
MNNGSDLVKLTRDQAIQELEAASHEFFHMSLAEFVDKARTNSLPCEQEFTAGEMIALLRILPVNDPYSLNPKRSTCVAGS